MATKNSTTKSTLSKNELPLMPLRDLVVYPHMIVPLFVGRGKSVQALEAAMLENREIVLATQIHAQIDEPTEEDIYKIGTKAQILQVLKMPDSTIKVLVEGQVRVNIKRVNNNNKFFTVNVETFPAKHKIDPTAKALMRNNVELFELYSKLNKKIPSDIVVSLNHIDDPGRFADIVAANILSKVEEKQKLLEIIDPIQRLEAVSKLLSVEIEILEIERRIKGRVRKQMESTQKEYYLHEQIKAIRKELGQKDEEGENEELITKVKKAKMTKDAEEKALKEIARLERMQAMSPEAAVIRTYVEWLLALPWNHSSKEKLDLKVVAAHMDQDHYGLRKVKDRILEYLAVRKLAPHMKGPILCLVGPPGVGKTSLARSVAESLNRKFIRISLGGVRDESEIRGHRRTYIGALPGRIIQALKSAKTNNPLVLLDEIDKMGSDFRGDPAAALLEVLDPEQNQAFDDHYLDTPFDISKIMFVATANVFYNLHPTLRDRMEVIDIPGYTLEEKVKIAEKHLIVRSIKDHGLTKKDVTMSKAVIEKIINEYTTEAGVRNLNREMSAVMRKLARLKVERKLGNKTKRVSPADIVKLLGPPKFIKRKGERKHAVGVATGLAWTEFGGEILLIEVTLMQGKGQLTLTGKLGDVMKESAQAAVSYTRAHAALMGIDEKFHQNTDIHIHVPEGAIPKDGPSAGIAITTAIISALTGIAVNRSVAMTGEITLRGRILAIGGLKEKLLAATRAGIKKVVVPQENEKDLVDCPEEVKKALDIHFISDMCDVLPLALVKAINCKDKKMKRVSKQIHARRTQQIVNNNYYTPKNQKH